MVRYSDPQDNPELGDERKRRSSPGEAMIRRRERNAALTGMAALEGAREVALRQLDAKACSSAQLRTAITTRGFSEEVAQEVISRLTRVGLVDDRAFARALVQDRFQVAGKAGPALVADLRRKGIPEDLIAEATAEVGEDDEMEKARELAARKRRALAGLDSQVVRRRLGGMLARRGYSVPVVSQVVNEFLESAGRDSEEMNDDSTCW